MSAIVAVSVVAVGLSLTAAMLGRKARRGKAGTLGEGGWTSGGGDTSSDCGSDGGGCD